MQDPYRLSLAPNGGISPDTHCSDNYPDTLLCTCNKVSETLLQIRQSTGARYVYKFQLLPLKIGYLDSSHSNGHEGDTAF